jgi:hypothetical protein
MARRAVWGAKRQQSAYRSYSAWQRRHQWCVFARRLACFHILQAQLGPYEIGKKDEIFKK